MHLYALLWHTLWGSIKHLQSLKFMSSALGLFIASAQMYTTFICNLPSSFGEKQSSHFDLNFHMTDLYDGQICVFGFRFFVFISSSVLGPILPAYYHTAWHGILTERLSGNVKLVGTTISCTSLIFDVDQEPTAHPHVQVKDCIWAAQVFWRSFLTWGSIALLQERCIWSALGLQLPTVHQGSNDDLGIWLGLWSGLGVAMLQQNRKLSKDQARPGSSRRHSICCETGCDSAECSICYRFYWTEAFEACWIIRLP